MTSNPMIVNPSFFDSLKQHKSVHNLLGSKASEIMSSIIGVFKQGELLETLEADNQQLSQT